MKLSKEQWMENYQNMKEAYFDMKKECLKEEIKVIRLKRKIKVLIVTLVFVLLSIGIGLGLN
jgi:hypothetical protein